MVEKRSKGITLFGVLGIIFSISLLLTITPKIFIVFKIQTLLQVIAAFGWLIFSIGILKLKSWARQGMIIVTMYYIFDTFFPPKVFWEALTKYFPISVIIITISLIFFCSIIFFFTRPKVKEQFK